MIRFMLDTDRLDKLTQHAELLATYSDLVPNPAELRAKYPHSEIVLIDRGLGDPSGQASVFDIESGALTLQSAVRRYDEQRAKQVPFLTVYHDRARATEVRAAFGNRKPWNWYATLDGTAHIQGYNALTGPAVIQVLSATELDYHADGSLVFEDGWHPTRSPISRAQVSAAITEARNDLSSLTSVLTRMAGYLGG